MADSPPFQPGRSSLRQHLARRDRRPSRPTPAQSRLGVAGRLGRGPDGSAGGRLMVERSLSADLLHLDRVAHPNRPGCKDVQVDTEHDAGIRREFVDGRSTRQRVRRPTASVSSRTRCGDARSGNSSRSCDIRYRTVWGWTNNAAATSSRLPWCSSHARNVSSSRRAVATGKVRNGARARARRSANASTSALSTSSGRWSSVSRISEERERARAARAYEEDARVHGRAGPGRRAAGPPSA